MEAERQMTKSEIMERDVKREREEATNAIAKKKMESLISGIEEHCMSAKTMRVELDHLKSIVDQGLFHATEHQIYEYKNGINPDGSRRGR